MSFLWTAELWRADFMWLGLSPTSVLSLGVWDNLTHLMGHPLRDILDSARLSLLKGVCGGGGGGGDDGAHL